MSRSGRGPLAAVLATVAAVVLLVVIAGVILLVRDGGPDFSGSAVDNGPAGGGDSVAEAAVGECVAGDPDGDDADQAEFRLVDCADADAGYTVVGRVEEQSREQADDDACQPYDRAELTYYAGRSDESGTVLCLEANG
jgi:hypothetical protein